MSWNAFPRAWFMVSLAAVLTCASCSDEAGSGGNGIPAGGCEWNGNCSTAAPNGAYDCLNDDFTLVQCVDGNWDFVASCSGFVQGNRSCTCKGGCGTNTVECSFAFDVCGGQQYETCGPNATAQINGVWECVPDP
jgi:hypothetical protein